MDELCAKLSKLWKYLKCEQKLKRRDNKIKENQCCMDNLTKEIEDKSATVANVFT